MRLASEKRYYLDIWESMFYAFKGWSIDDVKQWANSNGLLRDLDDPNSLVYHEPPQYWVLRELVNRHVLSAYDYANVVRDALQVFWSPTTRYSADPQTDWTPHLMRLRALIGDDLWYYGCPPGY